MNRRKGFTLIELLVVIAIIAILAAIIFPVFSRVKVGAYKSSDLSNMNAIRSSLQIYRADQGGYPPELLGYVTTYSGGSTPTVGDMVPANQVVGALFPKRISSLDTLRPAYLRPPTGSVTGFTAAYWPNKLDGSGGANPGMFQKYGPTDHYADNGSNVERCFNPGGGSPPVTAVSYYYTISGYDVANVQWEPGTPNAGKPRAEIHYAPFWSGYTVAADPCNATAQEHGSALDDPRQLGYSEPPGTTVVTWDTFFREYDAGELDHVKSDLVLFLEGNAKLYDSALMATISWKATP